MELALLLASVTIGTYIMKASMYFGLSPDDRTTQRKLITILPPGLDALIGGLAFELYEVEFKRTPDNNTSYKSQ